MSAVLLLMLMLGPLLPGEDATAAARAAMVRGLRDEGISDERVLDAIVRTPRDQFVPSAQRPLAYVDQALPIGHRQTISPPYIVAYMTQTLEVEAGHRVLEIGTGSGYQAAVLSPLAADVYTIEIVEPLAKTAARTLARLELSNVHTRTGDGYVGWPDAAPFDRIIVTCSPEDVPQPLIEQLAEGGRMLIPLGERYQQVFHLFEKRDGKLERTRLVPTLFVPMTGRSEELRHVQPDPANPAVVNGGFEDVTTGDNPRATGWHQQRLVTLEADAASGRRCVRLHNEDPGQLAQMLQGMPLDGRQVRELTLSASIRVDDVRFGAGGDERPAVDLFLFDSRRDTIGRLTLGPIRSDAAAWKPVSRDFRVPRQTREAIIRVGLNGATGTVWFDDISVTGR